MGACAMEAQICFASPSGRGAIARGRHAVTVWRLEHSAGKIRGLFTGIISGFCLGWISCFVWLIWPTLVYEY